MEEIDKGSLSREEYPYLKDPAGSSHQSSSSLSTRPPVNPNSKPVQSRRTVGKGGGSTWASKGRASSEDGYSRFVLPLVPSWLRANSCVAISMFHTARGINGMAMYHAFVFFKESVLRLCYLFCVTLATRC